MAENIELKVKDVVKLDVTKNDIIFINIRAEEEHADLGAFKNELKEHFKKWFNIDDPRIIVTACPGGIDIKALCFRDISGKLL